MLGIDKKVFNRPSERQVLTVGPQNCEKPALKHYVEKPVI